ncbi:porphobilinogen synthase [Maricaulaceae bacterium EIL42A08]|nr:porphobilinogen synthase [Maricaulaceae bacterium EIL42A08]
MASYPSTRLRRLRANDWIRRLVRENTLTPADLIWTVIVSDRADPTEPVPSMPGVERLSVAEAAKSAVRARDLGIPAIAIFPNIDPSLKDEEGSRADDPAGLVAQCIKAMKDAAPEVGIICDVALDPFTNHGHDGVLENGQILNDPTIDRLVDQALMQAEAGCDVIAPSDMMDGRVGALRAALDDEGFENVLILSYAAKYASAFYGPYRDAIGSSAALQGDKKTYQMDPANTDEALREVAMDIEEGADMVMVKPGLPYLDIVARVKAEFEMPTYAFQVSGEYAMIKAADANGWIDGERAMMESLLAFKRAGADGILSYFAPFAVEKLNG